LPTRLSAESLEILPISGAQFRTAARFADQYALGLRVRARMFHIGHLCDSRGAAKIKTQRIDRKGFSGAEHSR